MRMNCVMSKKISILTTLLFVFFLNIQAQTLSERTNLKSTSTESESLLKVIPPSPQSSMFDKYTDYPVNLCSGMVEMNIPLYEISLDGMKIPIQLSYRSSGVKYRQYDGDIGAGWVLSPGYRMTRSIHGKVDEAFNMPDNLLYETERRQGGHARDRYLACMAFNMSSELLPLPESSVFDSEYDQFHYMLPGSNGHFIITDRQNYGVEIIEGHPHKINLFDNSIPYSKMIEKALIKDDNGFSYYFGTGLDGTKTYECSNQAPTAWLLKDIVSPKGKAIRFTYARTPVLRINRNQDLLTFYDPVGHHINPTHQCQVSTGVSRNPDAFSYMADMCLPEEIITEKETIQFVRSDVDFINKKYLQLQEILIRDKNTGNLIKKIKFLHRKNGPHWLLTGIEIQEGGTNNQVIQRYGFEYHEPTDNFNEYNYYPDQWGYYHVGGSGNINHTEGSYHKEFETNMYHVPFGLPQPVKPKIQQFGVLREKSQNAICPDYFSLKKVYFPTGGWQAYEYESHEFQGLNGKTPGGGIRVKKITLWDGNSTMSRIFKYGHNENGIGIPSFLVDHKYFADELGYADLVTNTYEYITGRRYSTDILGDVNMDSHFSLYYPQVTVYDYDENQQKYNGKTEEYYDLPQKYGFTFDRPTIGEPDRNYTPNGNHGLYVDAYREGLVPVLSSRIVYKADDSSLSYHRLLEEQFLYKSVEEKYFDGLKVILKISTNVFEDRESPSSSSTNPYYYISSFFEYFPYQIITGKNDIIERKIETLYSTSGNIIKETNFEYNDQQQLTKTSNKQSDGSIISEIYKYPSDFTGIQVYQEMVNRNMLNPIVEKIQKRNLIELKKEKTNYSITSGINSLILPFSFETAFQGGNIKVEIMYDLYDSKGNIRQVTDKTGLSTVFLWGYNYQYPIAEIKGATYNEVAGILNENIINNLAVSMNPDMISISATLRDKLRELPGFKDRTILVSCYTYKPLVGISRAIAPRGVITRYEYDDFGRLIETRDHNNSLIESYEYHYQNQ